MLEKIELRKRVAYERKKYNTVLLEKWSDLILSKLEKIRSFKEAETVLMYYSLDDEVQTHDFVEKWKNYKNIFLPVVRGENLELRKYRGEKNLVKGAFQIFEPIGNAFVDYDNIDLVVVPGIAFDKDGNRLGRGKGYYDRLLPLIKGVKCGICFPFQIVNTVPTGPLDIKMDIVITL